ncbi:MAG: GNAT family N-acetyltransferase [Betaproteobacteria bacterium]
MKAALVPEGFVVPERLATDRFVLRPITIHDVVKDFDAVMTSRSQLAGVFGPSSDWPPDGLSLEQDLIDLGWHQKEFQIRSSFTYTVVAPDEARVLGCVYLLPSGKLDIDCAVYFWVRASELATGLENALNATLHDWLAECWPFRNPAFPGRSTAWPDWIRLP